MAVYATGNDVQQAWPRVLTSGLTAEEIEGMLARASNRIDVELCARFSVPFTSPYPPYIKDLTVDLAMLDVLHRSGQTPEFVIQRIQFAQAQLERLRAGELCLVAADGSVIAESNAATTIQSNTSSYTPVFGAVPSLDEGWDNDRVDAEKAARD